MIIDSREEHIAATERLHAADDEQLVRELADWAVRALDQQHAHHNLVEEMALVKRQYNESEAWIALVTEEIRARRGLKSLPEAGAADDVPDVFRQPWGAD